MTLPAISARMLEPSHPLPRARDEMAARVAQMLDRIVEDRVHKDRDRFIESIKGDDICRLASSYHNNDPCAFFKPPTRGSYNICFFVRFCSPSTDNVSNNRNARKETLG